MAIGCVYLIQQGETSKYKIGSSQNPENRVSQLQTGNPFPLKLVYFTPHCFYEHKERWLQKKWADYSVQETNGEWFDFEPGVLCHVVLDYSSIALEYVDYQISLKTVQMQEWLETRQILIDGQQKLQVKVAKYISDIASIQTQTEAINRQLVQAFRQLYSLI